MELSIRTLQQLAVGISVFSIIYNGAEGAVSVVYGELNSSYSLLFFGIQSFIEVISAFLVVWRFLEIAKPGDESSTTIPPETLKKEKYATVTIGILLIILVVGTWSTSIYALIQSHQPLGSTESLYISAISLGGMILIWLPKPYLAKKLDSSAMHGEAKCSLSCIYINLTLLIGTLVYHFWTGGWWVDSALAMILGVFFLKDGVEMIKWGSSKDFAGGCCGGCKSNQGNLAKPDSSDAEIGHTSTEAEDCWDNGRCKYEKVDSGCEEEAGDKRICKKPGVTIKCEKDNEKGCCKKDGPNDCNSLTAPLLPSLPGDLVSCKKDEKIEGCEKMTESDCCNKKEGNVLCGKGAEEKTICKKECSAS